MEWIFEHWKTLGGWAVALFVGLLAAWAALRAARKKSDPSPSVQNTQTGQTGGQGIQAQEIHGGVHQTVGADPTEIAHSYAEAMRKVGKLESENESLREQLSQGEDTSLTAVADAVEELSIEAERAEDPDPFEAALAELREGNPEAAEELFGQILKDRQADGELALKDAARAARHIGAIAFYHDTHKSLEAYQNAVALDPDDVEAWNKLGHLRYRLGDLDGAVSTYEKILSLGNTISDKEMIAVATGNLGIVYETRGDLDEAEDMYRKSLALNEQLGRKQGMAADYGNLGIVYRARGDLDEAEDMYRKSLALNEQLGRKQGMAADYGNLGMLTIERGDEKAGCALLKDAKRLFMELGAADKVELVASWIEEKGCDDTAEN